MKYKRSIPSLAQQLFRLSFFTHLFFLLFKLIEFFVESLLTHFDSDDLHDFEESGVVIKDLVFFKSLFFKFMIYEFFDAEKELDVVL